MSTTRILQVVVDGKEVDGGSVEIRIDGATLLQRPTSGPLQLIDPAFLLPPFSNNLVPDWRPKKVAIGVGFLELVGDKAAWISISRTGATVTWSSDAKSGIDLGGESVTFDLTQYLDEIDKSGHEIIAWGSPSRKLAANITSQIQGPLGRQLANSDHFYQLLSVRTQAYNSIICVVAGPNGVKDYRIQVEEEADVATVAEEIFNFQPQRYLEVGAGR